MASETQARPRPHLLADAWPPDDTEESAFGTDLHQTTILNLRLGINEVAHLSSSPGHPLPWQALDQIVLLGCQCPDGTDYRTVPDVFVYRQPIAPHRGSVALEVDGPPALIVEVLSESTYRADLDIERGKGYSYMRARVPEYLVLDPTGAYLLEHGQGWRLEDEAYHRWEPDGAGFWHSSQIPVAIGLEGALVAVYTRKGERQLREGEIARERARDREALALKDAELEALRRQLDELRRMQG